MNPTKISLEREYKTAEISLGSYLAKAIAQASRGNLDSAHAHLNAALGYVSDISEPITQDQRTAYNDLIPDLLDRICETRLEVQHAPRRKI